MTSAVRKSTGPPQSEIGDDDHLRPAVPLGEQARLAALQTTGLLETPAEERFDRITRLARRTFGVPIALVSLVDQSRQWFKSCQGLPVRETSREISFCGHAVAANETLVVGDTTCDARFRNNPLVASEPHIRFYAGEPIRCSEGRPLGTLCIIDRVARDFDEDDLATLQDLARMVEEQLVAYNAHSERGALLAELDDTRRRALLDDLTLIWNRRGIDSELQRELERAKREHSTLAVALLDVDFFKKVNDQHGHATGDAVLREVAQRMRGGLRPYDALGRYGGEEFLAVLPGATAKEAAAIGDRIRRRVGSRFVRFEHRELKVTVSVGVAATIAGAEAAGSLIARADAALYRSKSDGRDRVTIAEETVPEQ